MRDGATADARGGGRPPAQRGGEQLKSWGADRVGLGSGFTGRGWSGAEAGVAELRPGMMTEAEVGRIERDEQAGLAKLGLRLAEAKQLTAALQARIVPAQVAVLGERRRSCVACGHVLASKGHYGARFRSLFGDVPVRVRRLHVCPCQGPGAAKSFAVLNLGKDVVAPELAYVTARYAALRGGPRISVLPHFAWIMPLAERGGGAGRSWRDHTSGV